MNSSLRETPQPKKGDPPSTMTQYLHLPTPCACVLFHPKLPDITKSNKNFVKKQ